MNKGIGERLCELRRSMGFSQRDLAGKLRDLGVNVTNQAVSKWENGTTLPNARQFLALCQILEVSDVLAVFLEQSDVASAKGLNSLGLKKLSEYAELLHRSGLYEADSELPVLSPPRSLPVYSLSLCLDGNLLDSSEYELFTVQDEVPFEANFGVRIETESMEPEYHVGDVVWIRQQPSLSDGDIGVFSYLGGVYLRRLRDRVGGIRLQCINHNYPDVVVTRPSELRTLGKALDSENKIPGTDA